MGRIIIAEYEGLVGILVMIGIHQPWLRWTGIHKFAEAQLRIIVELEQASDEASQRRALIYLDAHQRRFACGDDSV